jgi:hypothetical protein
MSLRLLCAALLVAASWIALRRAVGAPIQRAASGMLVLDALPVAAMALWLLALGARPLTAAALLSILTLAMLCANRAKQAASGEPLVFSDTKLLGIVMQPQLYVHVLRPNRHFALAGLAVGGVVVAFYLEPPLWRMADTGPIAFAAAGFLLVPGLVRRCVRALRLPVPPPASIDPIANLAALGPILGTLSQASTASAERAQRQVAVTPGVSRLLPPVGPVEGPIILLQLESFFDARRLGPHIPPGLLPQFDRCVAGSVLHGRLDTPAYGANTVRTEFAALTGMTGEALGFDRFNPYAAFAAVPVDSIAWRLREQGCHTVCIHPFDGQFYGRDQVMPNLGFERFLDVRAFADVAPRHGYVSDASLVDKIASVLDECGPRTFILGISMGNHSPWLPPRDRSAADPVQAALAGFLSGLTETDAAVGRLADIMRQRWKTGLLLAFGDHQPQLPGSAHRPAGRDLSTDYVLWRPDHAFGQRCDLSAAMLPAMLLQEAARTTAGTMARARIATTNPGG